MAAIQPRAAAVLIVRDGALVTLDPNDVKVIQFDWDTDNLASGVGITTSTFTITTLRGAATLAKDSESIVTGARSTQLRLSTPTLGALYRIDNKIVTNESPAQTIDRHFKVLGQNK